MGDPRRFHIHREDLREGSALDVDPPFASLDVVLRQDHEAECGRLREQLDAARQALQQIADGEIPKRAWGAADAYNKVREFAARTALGVVGEAPNDE